MASSLRDRLYLACVATENPFIAVWTERRGVLFKIELYDKPFISRWRSLDGGAREAWFPNIILVPATLNYSMETLHFNCRRPTPKIEEKLKLVQIFSIVVPATSRNLNGSMTVIGRQWVAGSFKSVEWTLILGRQHGTQGGQFSS